MAKDKSSKDKKEKASTSSGITKKDHKKEKKEKKEKLTKAVIDPVTGDVSDKLLQEIEKQQADAVDGAAGKKEKKEKKEKKAKKEKDAEGDVEMDRADIVVPVVVKNGEDADGMLKRDAVRVSDGGAMLVPFAQPLGDEKISKKALKTIKKGAKCKSLKRGVKEVVKSIRKTPSTSTPSAPHGLVILAADISPPDVISHIPVLCEDHNIPYLFVHSRAELGLAGGTKRPTSVVMIVPSLGAGKVKKSKKEGKEGKEDAKDDGKKDREDLKESYDELVKAVKALQ